MSPSGLNGPQWHKSQNAIQNIYINVQLSPRHLEFAARGFGKTSRSMAPTLETASETGRSQGLEKSIPTTYNIDKERKLVLTTGFGFVTKEEVLILQDQISNDLEFDPTFSQIVDFAQLTGTDVGLTDVHIFARRDAFSSESRRAIVVKGDVAFGFAKIFELCRQLSGAHGIRVFRARDEAFDWILSTEAVSTTG